MRSSIIFNPDYITFQRVIANNNIYITNYNVYLMSSIVVIKWLYFVLSVGRRNNLIVFTNNIKYYLQ